MKIRHSFEQAICILLLIASSDGPLKSHQLSEILKVSDFSPNKHFFHLL